MYLIIGMDGMHEVTYGGLTVKDCNFAGGIIIINNANDNGSNTS